MKDFSIVIPLLNESESIPVLAREIEEALNSTTNNWECIWVDDGSFDSSWAELNKLSGRHRALKLSRNLGQSSAIMAGCDHAKFDLIVTLDADLQNNPKDIMRLLESLNESLDCVCGIRKKRNDKLISRRIPSFIANWLARRVTRVPVSDLGCTLRIFRKHLVTDNRLIGEMHRVLPVYFHLSGARMAEIAVDHRSRRFGNSKYGLNRIFKFMADILLAKVMSKITTRPLYFFGTISLVCLMMGLMAIFAELIRILYFVGLFQTTLVDMALILVSIAMLSLSLIMTVFGLLSEVIIRKSSSTNDKSQYNVIESK
jgi:glycosyltransferase involved in cell wall biosynthesis